MASAAQLNCTATIMSGEGLNTSPALLANISTYQNLKTVVLSANISTNASSANINIRPDLTGALSSLGSSNQFLLDSYPANIQPVCSGSIGYYGNVASASTTLLNQAQLPFAHGMSGFANVYQNVNARTQQVFDTVSSLHILQGKTIGDMGIGYNTTADVISGGFGDGTSILSDVISGWGTMYDSTNLSSFYDPYIFGQNILNQGGGQFGNLSTSLAATGLNISNLSVIPPTTTVQTNGDGTVTASTFVGAVDMPVTTITSSTTVVTGSSPLVVLGIYGGITGNALAHIVSATQITVSLTTMADYLDYSKVVGYADRTALATIGITDFATLAEYLHTRLGTSQFSSWKALATLLDSLNVPTLSHTTSNSTSSLLSAAATNLTSITGTGSGVFGNPVISDFLGASAGMPYAQTLNSINSIYASVAKPVEVALSVLDSAVVSYIDSYMPITDNTWTVSPITPVVNAVLNVNSALDSISSTAQADYTQMLSLMATECQNLTLVGAVFNGGIPQSLFSFATSVGSSGAESSQTGSYQFFGNIITDDSSGDTIRAAIAETINVRKLTSSGVVSYNDPQPALVLIQATQQGVTPDTYLQQNQ